MHGRSNWARRKGGEGEGGEEIPSPSAAMLGSLWGWASKEKRDEREREGKGKAGKGEEGHVRPSRGG